MPPVTEKKKKVARAAGPARKTKVTKKRRAQTKEPPEAVETTPPVSPCSTEATDPATPEVAPAARPPRKAKATKKSPPQATEPPDPIETTPPVSPCAAVTSDPAAPFDGQTLRDCRRIARQRFHIPSLHPEQAEAFESVLAGHDTLVVLPTGYGKSLIYQVLAMLTDRPVVTLFPLIALMRDQERALNAHGVPVVRLDSTLGKPAREEALARLRRGGRLVVLTTPETLESTDARRAFEHVRPALLCVDEAHCVSEWGHDFRPAYLRVGLERESLGNPQLLALTATATPRVKTDLVERLHMQRAEIIDAPPNRANLRLSARPATGNLKFQAAGKLIRRLSRPGIVYCATTKAVDEIYAALRRARIPTVRYHGKMSKIERTKAQQRYTKRGPRLVMVATSAFGMGIDKANIRYILHYQVPGSVEQYVQEAGRAGRDGRPSQCILLFDPEDLAIQKYLNERGHANYRQLRRLGLALSAWLVNGTAVDVKDLALAAEVPATTCRAMCAELEEAGLIERDAQKRYEARVEPEALVIAVEDLAARLDTARRQDARRLAAVADYATSDLCRSVFIRQWFGEEDPPRCGKCDRCRRSQELGGPVIAAPRKKRRRRSRSSRTRRSSRRPEA